LFYIVFFSAISFSQTLSINPFYKSSLINKSKNNQQIQNLSIVKKKSYRIQLASIPQSPGTPSYSATFTQTEQSATLTFWNQQIEDVTYLFVQVSPISDEFFFCASGNQFQIIQDNTKYGSAFRATRGNERSVCEALTKSEAFLIDQWSIYPNFKVDEPFVLSGDSKTVSGSVGVHISPTPTPTATATPTPTTDPSNPTPTPTVVNTNTSEVTTIVNTPLFENCNLNTVDNNAELTCKGVSQATCNDLLRFNAFMDWAETVNPELLSGGTTTFSILDYLARYYLAKNLYIGIRDGILYGVGDIFGKDVSHLGTLQSYIDYMQANK